MATTTSALALRRLGVLSRQVRASTNIVSKRCNSRSQIASFSTNPRSEKDVDPSDFVSGVTESDLEKDPRLKAYFAYNFPDQFSSDDNSKNIFASIEALYEKEVGSKSKKSSENVEDADEEIDEIDIMTKQCDLSLNIRPLIAYKRDEEGSRRCRLLRESTNMMPGIIFGSDPTKDILSLDASSKILVKTPWKYIQRELDKFTYHNFESRVYDLTLFEDEEDEEGTVHRVMPRDVQFHPVQNKIYCCNYLRYFPGKPINIPIVYINEEESPAMKRGGFIAPFNRHVSCIVEDGVKIPESIEMDCTDARLKTVMRRERLIFPDGVSPSRKVKEDFLIGTVFGRRADLE